jgi:HNH endonuclease
MAPQMRFVDIGTVRQRLWAGIDKTDSNQCWLWTRGKTKKGRGQLNITDEIGNKYVSRLVWEDIHGFVPDDMCVCHTCDNPLCCNPDHLFLGTVADNNADKETKGRGKHPFGAQAGRAILNEEQVVAIMACLLIGNETKASLARTYRVSESTIRAIWTLDTWEWLWASSPDNCGILVLKPIPVRMVTCHSCYEEMPEEDAHMHDCWTPDEETGE